MKKLLLATMLMTYGLMPNSASAQVNLNVNVGSQPLWGPTGYDRVDYYYLPDIESYYYVPTRQFIHQNNGKWMYSNVLPSRFANYNLYNGYKVVINSPKPFLNFEQQKVKYAKFKSNRSQSVIARSNDPKYYMIKGHPKHKLKGDSRRGSISQVKVKGGGKSKGENKSKGNGKGKG